MRRTAIGLALVFLFACASTLFMGRAVESNSLSRSQLRKKQGNPSKDSSPSQPDQGMQEKPMDSKSDSQVDSRLVLANTKFGFTLFSEIAKRDAGKNIFISPSSIALALAMTYNGADGETRQAMARALEVQGLTVAEVNAANAQLKAALEQADPKVKLEIANSLWARQGLQFQPDFIRTNKESYKAEVTELDFYKPSAAATINSWVSKSTHGKIEKIVDQIHPDTLLFLINAIYFKGTWSEQFNAALTREDNFTLANGAAKRLPMMSQSGRYAYFENDKLQAVALPYGNRRLSMYVFLPKQKNGLADFHQSLSAQNWNDWVSRFTQMKGDIVLPKFKVEYETGLKSHLSALGMGAAFRESADFSAMLKAPAKAFISEVKHKAYAEVNEEGTEAAAVTSVEMRTTSLGPPPKTFRMVVDHPFFFAIRDNQTGAILFMGSITEPK
jgi:serpin B